MDNNKEEETMVPSSNHCFYGADVRTSGEWKREASQSPVSEAGLSSNKE